MIVRLKSIVAQVLWPVDRALALLAYSGVASYRRWLSPRKGFACAHGLLTNSPSCSEVAARALMTTTLSQAIPVINEQFMCCRRTYNAYRSDLISVANNRLSQFGSFATVTAVGCCPGCDKGDDGGGPLFVREETRVVVVDNNGRPPSTGSVQPDPTDDKKRPQSDKGA